MVTFDTCRLKLLIRYFIDESKLRSLGWRKRVGWRQGLQMTIAWYLEYVRSGSYWPGYERALLAHPTPVISTMPMPEDTSAHQMAPAATAFSSTNSGPVFLIYGRSGWIGGLLGKLLSEQGAQWSFGVARLEDRGGITADIRRVKPTHVLNAAGVTGRPNVDWCESHRQETIRTNVIGVLNLVDVCKSNGVHVTNFATGCIYSYDTEHTAGNGIGFRETDPPNFS
jgi:UDP-glucose 4,6-dehydratase